MIKIHIIHINIMSVYLVVLIIITLQFQSKLETLFCKTTLNITIQ